MEVRFLDKTQFCMRSGFIIGLLCVLRDAGLLLLDPVGIAAEVVSSVLMVIILFLLYHYTALYLVSMREEYSYWESLKISVMTMFFAGMVFALYSYYYMTNINPNALSDSVALMTQMMGERLSVEEMKMVEEQIKMMTPARTAPYMCLSFATFGLLLGLFNGIIIRFTYKRVEATYKKVKEWADKEMNKLDDYDD